jgi:8-oxo-dGTP diphosphatase
MTEPRLFVAMKAFIIHSGKVLILRESSKYQDGSQIGQFDFPGGRVKPGERFDEGLIREVREETGLHVRLGRPIAVNEWRPVVRDEPWQIVGAFILCESDTDQVTLSEDHDEYQWIDPKDYAHLPIIPTNIPAFEAYLDLKH